MIKKWIGWAIVASLAFTVLFSGTVMAGKKNQSGTATILTDQEIEALLFMREKEKLARDVYSELAKIQMETSWVGMDQDGLTKLTKPIRYFLFL